MFLAVDQKRAPGHEDARRAHLVILDTRAYAALPSSCTHSAGRLLPSSYSLCREAARRPRAIVSVQRTGQATACHCPNKILLVSKCTRHGEQCIPSLDTRLPCGYTVGCHRVSPDCPTASNARAPTVSLPACQGAHMHSAAESSAQRTVPTAAWQIACASGCCDELLAWGCAHGPTARSALIVGIDAQPTARSALVLL